VILAAVETHGVNAEALAATLGPLLAMIGAGIKYLSSRLDNHHAENVGRFTDLQARVDSINEKGSVPMQGLANRLTAIEAHLERQDTANRQLSERVARLEGPIKRVEAAAAEAAGGAP
jgi:hypothetical protein